MGHLWLLQYASTEGSGSPGADRGGPGSLAGSERGENRAARHQESRGADGCQLKGDEDRIHLRTSLAVVYLELDENLKETGKELDDIKLKLDSITDLPGGAGPINFIKDFGDTAALMLTVSSPKIDETEIALRARLVQTGDRTRARPTWSLGSKIHPVA